MSADLALSSISDTAENRELLSRLSKLYEMEHPVEWEGEFSDLFYKLMNAVDDLVYVGPVSYAKAAFTDDPYWIPGPIAGVMRVFGDVYKTKAATPAFAAEVLSAMNTADRSHYRHDHRNKYRRGPMPRRKVKQFFGRNVGKLVFLTVD